MISFLNLAVVGLILSTFTTRFIFPMLSLEGRRFWILSMLPVKRDSILWGKFVFAAAGSSIPCCLLILLSDAMLQISSGAGRAPVDVFAVVRVCRHRRGSGAKMPDLHEESLEDRGRLRRHAVAGGQACYIIVVLLTALPDLRRRGANRRRHVLGQVWLVGARRHRWQAPWPRSCPGN
jgi:hypothetical protein